MRLSLVFELLLIFILLAFAASRVIEHRGRAAALERKAQRQGPPNRYCACTNLMCNCCREFSLPVVPIKGPGCATLSYLQGDSMMVTMSFGDRVLHNTTISGKRPKPVCMPLPGGISKFCGRVYGIQREGENFRACLSLELRALDDIEAALRVSCFRFGPPGINLEPAAPLPATPQDTDDDDDDDDDDYGFDVDDDDDDDDDEDDLESIVDDDDDDDDETDDDASENDVSPDYTGFSVFGDDFFGGLFGDSSSKKKKTKPLQTVFAKPVRATEKPILAATPFKPNKQSSKPATSRPSTTKPSTVKPSLRPVPGIRPVRPTARPILNRLSTTRRPLLPPKTRRTTTSTTTTSTTTSEPPTTAIADSASDNVKIETSSADPVEGPSTIDAEMEETVTSTAITITIIENGKPLGNDDAAADQMLKNDTAHTPIDYSSNTAIAEEATTESVTEESVQSVTTRTEQEMKPEQQEDSNKENQNDGESINEDKEVEESEEEEDEEQEDENDDDEEDYDEEEEDEDEEEIGTGIKRVPAVVTVSEGSSALEKVSDPGPDTKATEDDDEDDDDDFDLGLDDDDEEERKMQPVPKRRWSGRTHRRMRLRR